MFDTKSKLMVAAIGAAFALPIAAQAQTNVTVYGKLYPSLNHINQSGASAPGSSVSTLTSASGVLGGTTAVNNTSETSMESPNSRLGFKGSEDLGGGLSAIFQLEMGFSGDTGANSTADTPFSRNTFVGLSSTSFGTIRLGNMDTVYKELGDTMPFLGITSGNFMSLSNILSKANFTTNGNSSFHLRRTNSFYYTSPQIAGFTGLFDWSPQETVGDASSGVISTGIKYEGGPIYAALAYELHKDLFGGSGGVAASEQNTFATGASSKDQAIRGTFQYSFGNDWKAEVNAAHLRYSESGQTGAGKFDSYRHYTYSLSVEKDIGAVSLVGSYGHATAGSCSLTGAVACQTNGLTSNMYNLGLGYALSKRTQLFAVYSLMQNGQSATTSGSYLAAKTAPGQETSIVALGISHSF